MKVKKLDKRYRMHGIFDYVIISSDYHEYNSIRRYMNNLGWVEGATDFLSASVLKTSRYGDDYLNCKLYVSEKDATLLQLIFL